MSETLKTIAPALKIVSGVCGGVSFGLAIVGFAPGLGEIADVVNEGVLAVKTGADLGLLADGEPGAGEAALIDADGQRRPLPPPGCLLVRRDWTLGYAGPVPVDTHSIFMATPEPQPPRRVLVKLPVEGFTPADCEAFANHAGYHYVRYGDTTQQGYVDYPGLLDKHVPDYRQAIFNQAYATHVRGYGSPGASTDSPTREGALSHQHERTGRPTGRPRCITAGPSGGCESEPACARPAPWDPSPVGR